eukprot:Gb_41146 [translate_table: standard]
MKDRLKSIAKGFNQLEYFHILFHLNEAADKMENVGVLLRLGEVKIREKGTLPHEVEEKLICTVILRSGGESRASSDPLERFCVMGSIQDHSSSGDIRPIILWSRDIQVPPYLNLYSERDYEPMEIDGVEAWESQAVDVYRGESNPDFQ